MAAGEGIRLKLGAVDAFIGRGDRGDTFSMRKMLCAEKSKFAPMGMLERSLLWINGELAGIGISAAADMIGVSAGVSLIGCAKELPSCKNMTVSMRSVVI